MADHTCERHSPLSSTLSPFSRAQARTDNAAQNALFSKSFRTRDESLFVFLGCTAVPVPDNAVPRGNLFVSFRRASDFCTSVVCPTYRMSSIDSHNDPHLCKHCIMYEEGAVIDGRFRVLRVRLLTVGYICEVWLCRPDNPSSTLSRRVLVREAFRQTPSHCEMSFTGDHRFFHPTRHLRKTETSRRLDRKTNACANLSHFQEMCNLLHCNNRQNNESFEREVGTEKIYHIVLVRCLASLGCFLQVYHSDSCAENAIQRYC